MPRVPVIGSRSVMPSLPYSQTAPQLRAPDYSTANLVGAIGQAGTQVASSVGGYLQQQEAEQRKALALQQAAAEREAAAARAEVEKATQEAEELAEAEAMLAFESTADSVVAKLKQSRGLAASANSAEVLDRLETARAKVSEGMASPRARNRFLVKTAARLGAYRKDVEGYVGREFSAAQEETLTALQESAVAKAEAGLLDMEGYQSVQRDVGEKINGWARSREDAEARYQDFQAKLAAAAVTGLVAQGKGAEAEAFVKANKAMLGARYAESADYVKKQLAGAKKDEQTAFARDVVVQARQRMAEKGQRYVNEASLRNAVPNEGYDEATRAQVEDFIRETAQEEDRRLKADINSARDVANRADVDRKPIPGATEAFLREYDPDFLLSRRARRNAEYRAWKASQAGGDSAADEARKQRMVDEEFRHRLEAQLVNAPDTDVQAFAQSFIAEKAKGGDEVRLSDVALAAGGAAGAKAKKAEETGELAAEKAVAARLEQTLGTIGKTKKGPPDAKQLAERVGRGLVAYRQRVAANGGKPLAPAQVAALEADLLSQGDVYVPGRFGRERVEQRPLVDLIETPPAVPTSAPPAAGPANPASMTPKQQQALNWARANPRDPRSAAVLRMLGL